MQVKVRGDKPGEGGQTPAKQIFIQVRLQARGRDLI